ncbi:MAG: DNA-3-methyladenine glycosylase [Candidatus Eisenbacteria bacterium]
MARATTKTPKQPPANGADAKSGAQSEGRPAASPRAGAASVQAPSTLDLAAALKHLRGTSPRMAAVIRSSVKPELKRTRNPYRELTRAIIYQQLSGKAAATICARFVALYPGVTFPRPEAVLETPLETLRSVGLSKQKASYVVDLASRYCRGEIQHRRFARLSDEEISAELVQVKGIGQWSADMFLLFGLNRPDVLPVGDLGVRKGMQLYFDLPELPKPAEMMTLAEPWRPFRSIASWYMWRVAENGLEE